MGEWKLHLPSLVHPIQYLCKAHHAERISKSQVRWHFTRKHATQGTQIAKNATDLTQYSQYFPGEPFLQKMADAVGLTTHQVKGKHNKPIYKNYLQTARDEFAEKKSQRKSTQCSPQPRSPVNRSRPSSQSILHPTRQSVRTNINMADQRRSTDKLYNPARAQLPEPPTLVTNITSRHFLPRPLPVLNDSRRKEPAPTPNLTYSRHLSRHSIRHTLPVSIFA